MATHACACIHTILICIHVDSVFEGMKESLIIVATIMLCTQL